VNNSTTKFVPHKRSNEVHAQLYHYKMHYQVLLCEMTYFYRNGTLAKTY